MKSFSVASLLAIVLSAANALTINSLPMVVLQCDPLLVTWDATGSTPPFTLSVDVQRVTPLVTANSPALCSWSGLTGTSFTWTAVAVAGGTSLVISLRDSTGLLAQTAPFTVMPNPGTTCPSLSSTATGDPTSLGSSLSLVNPVIPSTFPPASTSTTISSGALSNIVNFGSAGLLAILVGAVLT